MQGPKWVVFKNGKDILPNKKRAGGIALPFFFEMKKTKSYDTGTKSDSLYRQQ
jgi:hypothetical protein